MINGIVQSNKTGDLVIIVCKPLDAKGKNWALHKSIEKVGIEIGYRFKYFGKTSIIEDILFKENYVEIVLDKEILEE